MAFTVPDDGCRLIYGGRRKDHSVTFSKPNIKDCIALAYDVPGTGEWEVEIVEDDNFKYRDLFERWVHDTNNGIFTTEVVTVTKYSKIGEVLSTFVTPPLLPVDISLMEIHWDLPYERKSFTVRFRVA